MANLNKKIICGLQQGSQPYQTIFTYSFSFECQSSKVANFMLLMVQNGQQFAWSNKDNGINGSKLPTIFLIKQRLFC